MNEPDDAVRILMEQFPDGHPAADELIGLRSACTKLRAEVKRLREQLSISHASEIISRDVEIARLTADVAELSRVLNGIANRRDFADRVLERRAPEQKP